MTSGSFAGEQQRREVDQVAAPDHPGVRAGSFDVGKRDVLRFQPRLEFTVVVDEVVAGSAGNPQRSQLRSLLGVERREGSRVVVKQSAGTEGPDIGELFDVAEPRVR